MVVRDLIKTDDGAILLIVDDKNGDLLRLTLRKSGQSSFL
jgi:glucose/arabinose dehydrogenase